MNTLRVCVPSFYMLRSLPKSSVPGAQKKKKDKIGLWSNYLNAKGFFLLVLQAAPGNAPKSAPAPPQNTQPAIMKPTEEPPAYSQQQTQVRYWLLSSFLDPNILSLFFVLPFLVHVAKQQHILLSLLPTFSPAYKTLFLCLGVPQRFLKSLDHFSLRNYRDTNVPDCKSWLFPW